MKRSSGIVLVSAALAIVAITACGKKESPADTTPTSTATTPPTPVHTTTATTTATVPPVPIHITPPGTGGTGAGGTGHGGAATGGGGAAVTARGGSPVNIRR